MMDEGIDKKFDELPRVIEGYSLMHSDPSSTHRRCFTVLREDIIASPSPSSSPPGVIQFPLNPPDDAAQSEAVRAFNSHYSP